MYLDISLISPDTLREHIRQGTGKIRTEFSERLPAGFDDSRKLYRRFRIDPTRYRPSSEALWRRVNKGGFLPEINPFVDLTNFLSLTFMTPYGLYDIGRLTGDIELASGDADAWYEGIRKDRVTLHGKIILRDSKGPFGNPSSDSLRASTGGLTRNILQVIFFDRDASGSEMILRSSREWFLRFFTVSEVLSEFV